MKSAMFGVLLVLSAPVYADEFYLHIASEHAGNKPHLNENNYGIGWRDDGKLALTAGYYRNSWNKDSFYLGGSLKLNLYLSVNLIGVTGYNNTSATTERYLIADEILPIPTVNILFLPYRKISPALTLAPTQDGGVVLFSLVAVM